MELFNVIITVLLIAFVAGKIAASVKKAFAVTGKAGAGHTDDDVFGQFPDDEPFSDNEPSADDQNEYFSYENMPGNTCFVDDVVAEKDGETGNYTVATTENGTPASDFDLRQAVLYDIILHNDCMGERF